MTVDHPIIKCIERAVHFMAAELQQERTPSLDEIAQASGLSKFHFHRLYRLLTGETCTQTLTRLKLARGTAALKDAATSVTDAAFTAGYASSQAFAKAMKREVAENASSLRSDPDRLARTIHSLLEPNAADRQPAAHLRLEICSLEPIEILLVRTQDRYPDLAETYGMLAQAAATPEDIHAFLGIPHRDIETYADGGFIFDCGLALKNSPSSTMDGLIIEHIPAGTYLVVRHTGPDALLPETLNALYGYMLSQNDIIPADTAPLHHYIDDPEIVPEAACRTDIYIRLETQTAKGLL